ncbi:MAG: 2-succinyl-5-enolpyruvyl-6-hydroxy-3-cyclohexene-1-carboxylic-acid synthase [Actinomycetota bacterium]|nr:2-succinyl-5-enolpyruvyl-6-hydroxy-3-cyclohexene-1-carboxylic-acid synthase [Actinomycetota bacterium]
MTGHTEAADRSEPATTPAATFCATFVDEWIRSGSTGAFVAPGSRSTPLALALAQRSEVEVSVFHDERAASFAALGWSIRTARPAIVLCSSGTAGAHFFGAVIEASMSAVPLIVVTADRPPELWDVGAAQTIDQTHLFGDKVRWFGAPGVPETDQAATWRSWASRAIAEASGGAGQSRPGPVHLNLSFRDPLAGRAAELPPGRPDGRPWHRATHATFDHDLVDLFRTLSGRDGVIVAGGGVTDPASVVALAERLGWPLLADHRSGCRKPGVAIAHFDGLLRNPAFADAQRPEVIVRFGEPLTSKVTNQWLASSGAELIVAAPRGRWLDPERLASTIVPEACFAAALLAQFPAQRIDTPTTNSDRSPSPAKPSPANQWRAADARAGADVQYLLASEPLNDPTVTRALLASLPTGSALVAASSMAVRELEWFGANRDDVSVYSNRGANGIDGTIATAIGIASTGVPTACLIGDVAFLHDSTALVGLARPMIDLTIVVLDNDGGGIFGFLPQHDLVSSDQFELLFGTPHGTDLRGLAAAHHLTAADWPNTDTGLADLAPEGVKVFIARTDREASLDLHRRLNARLASAAQAPD